MSHEYDYESELEWEDIIDAESVSTDESEDELGDCSENEDQVSHAETSFCRAGWCRMATFPMRRVAKKLKWELLAAQTEQLDAKKAQKIPEIKGPLLARQEKGHPIRTHGLCLFTLRRPLVLEFPVDAKAMRVSS